jgi:putative FmdB family regulatory protein
MPSYGFRCEGCENRFDEFLSMEERDLPLKKACPTCKKKKVVREFNSYTQNIGSDATLTPNKATGGQWNELMGRMKKGVAKRYHKNLDIASSQTGKYWAG